MADTRTNAGVDNISSVKKLRTWSVPGERVVTVLSAGNLATTQTVISLLEERTFHPSERDPSILTQPTMFEVARLVGSTLREVVVEHRGMGGPDSEGEFGATMIVGGQIKGMKPRLFLVYPEGNFIETTVDSPFFQVGEIKYGRPILLRAFDPTMSFEAAVKLLVVSFDSTIKANLSVGLPVDLHVYVDDSLEEGEVRRFERRDPYFAEISQTWGSALREAFGSLPDFEF